MSGTAPNFTVSSILFKLELVGRYLTMNTCIYITDDFLGPGEISNKFKVLFAVLCISECNTIPFSFRYVSKD